MDNHDKYMQRALDLAEKGLGKVSPNPMVGCVIVKDGQIIGEGYHQIYGGPHAEVNAVNDCSNKSDIKGAKVYVTLEPCSHRGKTPPCADLLVEYGPAKVVICNGDPNPLVSGRGINKLRDAGIEVIENVLEEKGDEINKRFFHAMRTKKPYVILKWAETADGFIARENYDSKWISNEESRGLVHQWRSEEAGIMVGTNTAEYDNPRLNVRGIEGDDPVRIVLDKDLRLSKELNLFDQSQRTICYNASENRLDDSVEYVKLDFEADIIEQIYSDLFEKGIHSLIIEGGSQLLDTVISSGNYNEIRRFVATNVHFEKGISAPAIPDTSPVLKKQSIQEDELLIYSAGTM